jgi:hypothetical protein
MSIIILSVILIAFIWALTSLRMTIRYLARGLSLVIALAAAAAAIGLIAIGQKAHWTSDGPGMLLIMLGIPICGLVAWVFGMLVLTTTGSSEGATPDHPARTRSLTQAWELYKDLTKKPH